MVKPCPNPGPLISRFFLPDTFFRPGLLAEQRVGVRWDLQLNMLRPLATVSFRRTLRPRIEPGLNAAYFSSGVTYTIGPREELSGEVGIDRLALVQAVHLEELVKPGRLELVMERIAAHELLVGAQQLDLHREPSAIAMAVEATPVRT